MYENSASEFTNNKRHPCCEGLPLGLWGDCALRNRQGMNRTQLINSMCSLRASRPSFVQEARAADSSQQWDRKPSKKEIKRTKGEAVNCLWMVQQGEKMMSQLDSQIPYKKLRLMNFLAGPEKEGHQFTTHLRIYIYMHLYEFHAPFGFCKIAKRKEKRKRR